VVRICRSFHSACLSWMPVLLHRLPVRGTLRK
jgi:hypothetical protein